MSSAPIAHCQCSMEGRTRRVLIVKRLHPAVTMQSLLNTFSTYGAVTGCKVFTHKSGRSAGCASVEFASHQAACTAFRELQGTQLHGKTVCLQWFDHNLSMVSPVRTVAKRIDAASPMIASCHRSCQGSLQPGIPIASTALPVAQTPFSMLASSPHDSYFDTGTAMAAAAATVAAAAAVHQQQMAASQRPQRQLSAPSHLPITQLHATGLSASIASLLSGGVNMEALTSPGPLSELDGCQDGIQDPAAVAAAAAINLSAGMLGASLPNGMAQDMSALSQLAILQQQQQQHAAAALALQQMAIGNNCSLQLDDQQTSPLSPARSSQHHQQVLAQAAMHSQHQQMQQDILTTPIEARGKTRLQMARSMPVELSASFGSLRSNGSQSQLHSSSLLAQTTQEEPAAATSSSAGLLQKLSSTALEQVTNLGDGRTGMLGAPSAAKDGSLAAGESDIAQPSRRSLAGNKTNAKKQLFTDGASCAGDGGLSMLQSAGCSWPQHSDRLKMSSAKAAQTATQEVLQERSALSAANDTVSTAPCVDAPVSGTTAHSSAAWSARRDQHCSAALPADYLAHLHSYPLEQLHCNNAFLHATNEQIAAAAAAAALAVEQQQHMAMAAYQMQQPATSPYATSQQFQNLRMSDTGCMADYAAKLSSIRLKDPRASDSQLLSRGYHQRGNMHISSPLHSGSHGRGFNQSSASILAGASQPWQPGAAAMPGHKRGTTGSSLQTAAFKQKQQLQLQVPDFELVSAPMTCTAVPGGWEQTLIGTDCVPESPAAAVSGSQNNMQAMFEANGGASMTPAARTNWNDSCWSSSMALSALLSPAHVSSLAGRSHADPSGPPFARDVLPSIRVSAVDPDEPVRCAPTAASWANTAGRTSSSCLTAVSEHTGPGAAEATANGQLIARTTRHSSLCLDVQQQVGTVTKGAQEQLSRSSKTGIMNSESLSDGDQALSTVPSDPGSLHSMGSFTFTPHASQHTQPGMATPFTSCGEGTVITEPFQMPAFFRPSASNHTLSGSPAATADCSSPSAAAAPACAVAVGHVQVPHQPSLGSASVEDDIFGQSPEQKQLHHAASLPATFRQAAVTASPHHPEGHQQEHALLGGYGDVYKQLWGSGGS